MFHDAGLVRKVDALFSIDAMVHVDLQYLVTYWINAALVLRTGGRVLMTLADPTSEAGFQKLIRDIRKFYKFQGRMCPKFEYLSVPIVRRVLESIGFEIEMLEHWAQRPGAAPRDIYLIARMARPEQADGFRLAIQVPANQGTDQIASLGQSGPETYGEMWDRYASRSLATATPDNSEIITSIFQHVFEPANVRNWQYAIEIGGGNGKYAERVLAVNSRLKLSRFDVSRKFLEAASLRLNEHVSKKRVVSHEIDGTRPDAIYRIFETEGLVRKIDAMFSIDSMRHVDLQYITAHLVNAALILKKDGYVVMNVGDATSDAGFQKLIGDISKYYRYQGRTCPRFEYQSPDMINSILERLGFAIQYLEPWSPQQWEPGRDLYLVAQLKDPARADTFRYAVTSGLIPMLVSNGGSRPQGDDDVPSSTTDERRNIARALGLAYWRRLLVESNPDITKEQMQQQMKDSWGGSRREYTRLGLAVLRQLENMGYSIVREQTSAPNHKVNEDV